MVIRHVSRAVIARSVALALGAALLLPVPGAAARSREPEPPRPRPLPARSQLDRPGTQANPGGPGTAAPPSDLSALSWIVADARSGEILAARDAHRKLPPASTLKALFAVTALPHLRSGGTHTVTDGELEGIGFGSSMVGVEAGYRYRVDDLWRGVFLSSGNDAVRVLSAMNGGFAATVRQMQAKARSLGALDTKVVSPDGYDAEGQVSSAYDLAVFGREGLTDPEFIRYASTKLADFPGGRVTYPIQNTNRLLTGADGVDAYRGLIGVKNGYTTNAGNTLIAAAERDGRTVIATVMNPQDGGHAVYEEARALLDWGFTAVGRVRPVGSLLPPPPPPRPAPGAVSPSAAAPSPRPLAVSVAQQGEVAEGDGGWSTGSVVGTGAVLALVGAAVFRARARGRRGARGEH
ncbi:D-alanyl-D-alanine carboxypeptidase family protein [Streptomyces uncialis]|uniref:D-alanyl-D-alanine carboxypeptidase n=1 Tax=Streptomyces uncialis TaxID=1048205 RepID=A0A1Q4UYH0_9ACTN|nr:D-alanyl-D-alanine carboxypeptidase [Streptomyces uncialis]MCX4662373.1 D-alanyl-D-alanine carboxypeptidase [Streptomyces uncialis]OKH90583.1 D-alanyl-D-alanine carboxypeptidase [Streptomyces uncialis]WST71701.1 D-alanyl-D-alanine carboxypeptidase [Streptomyces uncialis]WTE09617.1 D-alanyl-D-alanine carboxypeptidase [Streptomyces uncialis]